MDLHIEDGIDINVLFSALAQSPDGIAVLDRNGVYLYVNPAWEVLHRHSAEESIGRTDDELDSSETAIRIREEGRRLMSDRESAEYEFSVVRKDAPPMRTRVMMTKLRDAHGNHNGYIVTSRDVTEWGHLKQTLEEEKSRLERQHRRQEALAAIELAINEPDELQAVLNRIVAIVTELLPASGGASILLWDALNQSYTISASSVPSQPTSITAQRVRQQGGATRWIVEQKKPVVINDISEDPFGANPLLQEFGLRAYAGVPLLSRDECLGVLYALDTTVRDYSANDIDFLTTLAARASIVVGKVKLYEHLRTTNRLLHRYATGLAVRNADLDTFAHTVAHDLKNPITSIMGFADMLLADYSLLSDEERLEFLGYIAQRSVKMRQIVDELLLLSQMGDQEMTLTPVDMRAIVGEAYNRLEEDRRQRQAVFHLPEQWPSALGYPQWLEEVWMNYMSNAIKYGGTPPEAWLGATDCGDGFIRFWIKDNGAGLSEEQQTQLFQPFTRLHTGGPEGHGLGLSIVRRIVEKCRGEVGVESAPGTGSTFWFTLPQAKE